MAVQPSGDGGGGVFQHTVDWGQVASRTVAMSVDILSRYSAANIDHYTLEVGRIMSSQFALSRQGTNNLIKAYNTLQCIGLLGDALYLGFGIRHAVRAMQSTTEGLTCLALCGVLSEYYERDTAAEILHELVKTFKVPPQGTPSLLQWRALIDACAGSLAHSDFATLVDDMIDLSPYPWYAMMEAAVDAEEEDTTVISRGWSTPTSIAEALRAVGDVSLGRMKAVTIVGGNDAGWIAAICIWLFGLRTIVYDADDMQLYSNCNSYGPQIKIIYQQRIIEPPSAAQREHADTRQLVCIGQTFVLVDALDFISRRGRCKTNLISGRTPWDLFLAATFGPEFSAIMESQHLVFATAIGDAARVLQGIVSAEEGIPPCLINEWESFVSGSYGMSYIQNLIRWFPELARLEEIAQKVVKKPLMSAIASFQQSITWLETSCSCFRCKGVASNTTIHMICRPALVETILRLGLLLSDLEVEEGLLPKRSAAMFLYREHQTRRVAKGAKKVPAWYHDVLGPLSNLTVYEQGIARGLNTGLHLFGGGAAEFGPLSACCDQGICAYSAILADFTDNIEIAGKTCIIAGTIELHGKPHARLQDPDNFLIGKSVGLESLRGATKLALNARENINGLEAWLESPADIGQDGQDHKLVIAPFDFRTRLLEARARINCMRPECSEVVTIPDEENVRFSVLGTEARVFRGNALSRCTAMALAASRGWKCVSDVDRCIQCCIKASMSREAETPDREDEDEHPFPELPKKGLLIVLPQERSHIT